MWPQRHAKKKEQTKKAKANAFSAVMLNRAYTFFFVSFVCCCCQETKQRNTFTHFEKLYVQTCIHECVMLPPQAQIVSSWNNHTFCISCMRFANAVQKEQEHRIESVVHVDLLLLLLLCLCWKRVLNVLKYDRHCWRSGGGHHTTIVVLVCCCFCFFVSQTTTRLCVIGMMPARVKTLPFYYNSKNLELDVFLLFFVIVQKKCFLAFWSLLSLSSAFSIINKCLRNVDTII